MGKDEIKKAGDCEKLCVSNNRHDLSMNDVFDKNHSLNLIVVCSLIYGVYYFLNVFLLLLNDKNLAQPKQSAFKLFPLSHLNEQHKNSRHAKVNIFVPHPCKPRFFMFTKSRRYTKQLDGLFFRLIHDG